MATEPKLIDGSRSMLCEYVQYIRSDDYEREIRLHGGRVPAITDVDLDAEPSYAFVNFGRWIAECPQDRCTGTSPVWINGPHLFLCIVCANLGIRQRFRRVIVPDNWQDIESILFERHIYTERNWIPALTVADLLVENHQLGYAIPAGFEAEAEAALAQYAEIQAELTWREARAQESESEQIIAPSITDDLPAVIPPAEREG